MSATAPEPQPLLLAAVPDEPVTDPSDASFPAAQPPTLREVSQLTWTRAPATAADPSRDRASDGGVSLGASDLLTAWWEGLTAGRRGQLLALGAGDPLPQSIAVDLTRRGLTCPLVLVEEGRRQVRRAVSPPELLDFLQVRRGGTQPDSTPAAGGLATAG